jgi:hypothetical protein
MGFLVGGLSPHSPLDAITEDHTLDSLKGNSSAPCSRLVVRARWLKTGHPQGCSAPTQTSLRGSRGLPYMHDSAHIQFEASRETGQIRQFTITRGWETEGNLVSLLPLETQQPSYLRWSLVPCQPLWLPRDTDQDCTTQSSVCYTQQLPHPYPCPHRHLETSEKGTERTLEKALELLSRDSKGEDCVHTQPCPEHSQGLWPKSNHVMDLITQCAMFCLLALVTMLVLSKGCHYQIPEASWNQRQGFNKAEGGNDGMKEEGIYRKREGRRERRTGGAKQSDHSINIQWNNQA